MIEQPSVGLEITRIALIALPLLMASNLLFLRYIPTSCSPFSISITTTYPFAHMHGFPSYIPFICSYHLFLPFGLLLDTHGAGRSMIPFHYSGMKHTHTHTSPFSVRLKNAIGCRYGAPAQCYDWTTMSLPFGAPWNGRATLGGLVFQ